MEKKEYYCRVGPVGGSDYWRDRSARDEKSQSIVVARIRNGNGNDNASKRPFHSSASILTLFERSGFALSWTPSIHRSSRFPLLALLGTDVGKSKPTKSSTDILALRCMHSASNARAPRTLALNLTLRLTLAPQ